MRPRRWRQTQHKAAARELQEIRVAARNLPRHTRSGGGGGGYRSSGKLANSHLQLGEFAALSAQVCVWPARAPPRKRRAVPSAPQTHRHYCTVQQKHGLNRMAANCVFLALAALFGLEWPKSAAAVAAAARVAAAVDLMVEHA